MPTLKAHRKSIAVGVVVLLAVPVLSAWLSSGDPPPQFMTAIAGRADIDQVVLATGVLQARRKVDVGAQVSGQLKSLKVELGESVEKGQLLAEIDPALSENALQQARAGLDSLIAQKAARQIRFSQAEANLKRETEMLTQGAGSPQELENATTEVKALSADITALDAQIRQQHLAIATAQTNLSYTRIVAPMEGEVVAISTLEGQTVVASYEVPSILKLADLSIMTVKAQISEADVIRISVGQPVYFTILGDPDKRYHARLRAIQPSPETVNNAVFFNALFDVPNPDRRLRVDMTAQVAVILGEARNVLTIPRLALGARAQDGRYSVRVLTPDNKVEKRLIRTSISNALQVQVLEGLKEGEKVITGDAANLPPEPDGPIASM